MTPTDTSEKGLETLIVDSLVNEAGYVPGRRLRPKKPGRKPKSAENWYTGTGIAPELLNIYKNHSATPKKSQIWPTILIHSRHACFF